MKVALVIFQDGMGNLHLSQDGIHLEGISEFLLPLYMNEIQSRKVSRLALVLPGELWERKPGYAESSSDIKISRWQLITSMPTSLFPLGFFLLLISCLILAALSRLPIGRRWAVGRFSSSFYPCPTQQEIAADHRARHGPSIGPQLKRNKRRGGKKVPAIF